MAGGILQHENARFLFARSTSASEARDSARLEAFLVVGEHFYVSIKLDFDNADRSPNPAARLLGKISETQQLSICPEASEFARLLAKLLL